MMMRSFLRSLAVVAAAVVLVVPSFASNYILALTPTGNLSSVLTRYGLVLVRSISGDDQTVFLVTTPQMFTAAMATQIASDPNVRHFEADAAVSSPETPPPSPVAVNLAVLASAIQNKAPMSYYGATVRSGYVQQPAATLVNLPNAQTYGTGGGSTVAIIDTGIDPTHPAFKDVLVPGYDFIHNQAGYANELADLNQSTVAILDQSTVAILDKMFAAILNQSTVAILDQSTVAILDGTNIPADFGHGTMVAGLIHLVAPTASIMPLKAFQSNGTANVSDIINAIYYAVDHKATVINMSFSSHTSSTSLASAIQYAWSNGVTCVASVGNNGRETTVYPAAVSKTIGVGSTSMLDTRSVFSNYGDDVRLAAPGEGLITTYPGNNYAGVWGTSFSTALVSGAAALLSALNPTAWQGALTYTLKNGHKLPIAIEGLGGARLDVNASAILYLSQTPRPPDD